MTKQFDFSTVLSFITGRLYCDIGCLYEISKFLTQRSVQTIELLGIRDKYKDKVLSQLSEPQQEICKNWKHTADWQEQVGQLNKNEVVVLTN